MMISFTGKNGAPAGDLKVGGARMPQDWEVASLEGLLDVILLETYVNAPERFMSLE